VCSTYRIPDRHSRSGRRRRPGVAKAPLPGRKERLDQLPQLVRHDPGSAGHRHPLP
jgi:hypothetical protein